jgi:hypothetical protein
MMLSIFPGLQVASEKYLLHTSLEELHFWEGKYTEEERAWCLLHGTWDRRAKVLLEAFERRRIEAWDLKVRVGELSGRQGGNIVGVEVIQHR